MVIDGVPVSVVCIAGSLTDTGRFFMRFSRLFRGILLALTGAVTSYTGCAIAENKPSPDNINFDVDALRSLGYGAEIADFFKAGSQFFPGDHDVVIKVNGTGSYSELVTIGDRGQLCVTPELIRKLKLKAAPFDATCKQLSDIIPDPLPVCDPFIIRNNRLHSGCIFWQPADFSANSEGVIQPREEWGRLWL